METKNPVPEVKVHHPLNPFMGKSFKIVTYNNKGEEVRSIPTTIESQEQLKTVLDGIKQYNNEISEMGGNLYQKLITE